jgi:molybdopterin/thiamine biosynthesis adenylyltransferase
VIVGCGALGTAIADSLARCGIGRMRIVDRDFVELSDLHRQVLFDEDDARRRLPKAVAAANRLREVNSSVEIEPCVCDLTARNVEAAVAGFSVVLDGTDNLETRFLLNDACLKVGTPWIYGGAVGCTAMVMPIVPGRSPCFRCLVEELPPPGALPTCDRAGVLHAASSTAGHLQAAAALRFLVGTEEAPWRLLIVDVWRGEFSAVEIARRNDCLACVRHSYEFLNAAASSWATVLCGRDAVQISPPEERPMSLESLATSLRGTAEMQFNGFLLTITLDGHELVVFPTGRAIVKGTRDESLARTLYAKYVGM